MSKKPTLFVHIGPMKTGTTSLQVALSRSRHQLAKNGIAYLTSQQNANVNFAALGMIGPTKIMDGDWHSWDQRDTEWQRLKSQLLSSSSDTTVISGEAFALADDQAIAELAQVCSKFDVHLVVTLRRIADLVPSYWQEHAKRRPYPVLSDFVNNVVHREGEVLSERFWSCQEHDVLIRRWQAIMKPTETTVIIPDKRQPTLLLNAFVALLNVPHELGSTIAGEAASYKNRSQTVEEMAVRQGLFRMLEQRGLMKTARYFTQKLSDANGDRTPLQEEHPIRLDRSSRAALLPIETRIVDELNRLPLRVIGNLESLAAPISAQDREEAEPAMSISGLVDASSHMMTSILMRAGIREEGRVDLGWLAKRATIRHLWSLALTNTAWAILPRRLHQPVRRLIANTRRSK
jgi:hypothetical protein